MAPPQPQTSPLPPPPGRTPAIPLERRRRWAKVLAAVLLTALAAALGCWLTADAVVRAASEERMFDEETAPARDVAIVLGALVYPNGEPSVVLEDRLLGALGLYRAGKVRKVLVSGDHGRRSYDEVNAMAAWLFRHGVPASDVFLDHAGFRTLDTMMRASHVFGVRSAIVCTQRFHLPRAVFLARRSGMDAVGLVVDRGPYPHALFDRQRERFAVVKAVFDTCVVHKKPRFWGPPIPIQGDGRITHDREAAADSAGEP